jgi:hypothetical protein
VRARRAPRGRRKGPKNPRPSPKLRDVRAAQALRALGASRIEVSRATGLLYQDVQALTREQYRQWRELRDTAARWLVAIGWTWQAVAASFGLSKGWRPVTGTTRSASRSSPRPRRSSPAPWRT